jgi:glycerol uptake facilitator-like aquaporin
MIPLFKLFLTFKQHILNILYIAIHYFLQRPNGPALSPAKIAGRKQRAAVLTNRKLLSTNQVYYKIF